MRIFLMINMYPEASPFLQSILLRLLFELTSPRFYFIFVTMPFQQRVDKATLLESKNCFIIIQTMDHKH